MSRAAPNQPTNLKNPEVTRIEPIMLIDKLKKSVVYKERICNSV